MGKRAFLGVAFSKMTRSNFSCKCARRKFFGRRESRGRSESDDAGGESLRRFRVEISVADVVISSVLCSAASRGRRSSEVSAGRSRRGLPVGAAGFELARSRTERQRPTCSASFGLAAAFRKLRAVADFASGGCLVTTVKD